MAKSTRDASLVSKFLTGLFEAYYQLPLEAKLAGFFGLIVLAVLKITNPALEGWQYIVLFAMLIFFFCFAVFFGQRRAVAAVPTAAIPFVLSPNFLVGMEAVPIAWLLNLNAHAQTQATQIRDIAEQTRRNKVQNSDAHIIDRIETILDVSKPMATALLTWADRTA